MDIIASLRSRLDIILDEADDDSTANDVENLPSQKATRVIFHELRYFLSSVEDFCFEYLYFTVLWKPRLFTFSPLVNVFEIITIVIFFL